MLRYPVRLSRTDNGRVRASFPDVPDATAEAANEEDALFQAKFALELTLGHRLINDRHIPPPSDIDTGHTITTDKFILPETAAGQPSPVSGGRY